LKIVVAGAAGYLGRQLCDALVAAGNSVVGLVRPESNTLGFPPAVDVRKVTHWQSAALAPLLDGADAVVNLVGLQGGDEVPSHVIREANIAVPSEVAGAAAGRVGRFVQVSSVRVYGVRQRLPITEYTAPSPNSEYGRAKLEAEAHISRILPKQAVVLRLSEVYGPGDHRSMLARLVKLLARRPRAIPGNGENLVHPCYISDAVQGIVSAIATEVGGTFLVAGPRPVCMGSIINQCATRLGVPLPTIRLPVVPLVALAYACGYLRYAGVDIPLTVSRVQTLCDSRSYDASYSHRILRFQPRIEIETGLPLLIESLLKEGYVTTRS